MKSVLALVLLVVYFTFGPLLFIWSLNTLFNLNILYTFNTWLASYILLVIFNMATSSTTKIVQNQDDKYNDEKANQKTINADS